MRRLTALVAILVMVPSLAWAQASADPPSTGPSRKRPLIDEAMLKHLERSRCTAATFAVMRDGNIVYERGYGWLDRAKEEPTPANTPMRVASISKPITAAAIKKLIRKKRLKMDDKVFSLLELKRPAGESFDARWEQVTIGELLDHKGGWDIKLLGFDPMFSPARAVKELYLDHPATPADIVDWMLTKPLQFDPNERSAYSNFGYCILGRVIEKVTKQQYLHCIQQDIFRPAGIDPKGLWLAFADPAKRDPREPWYNEKLDVDVMDSHGGIVISSQVLCQFLQKYWISGEPRKPDQKGFVYTFFGSMPGTSAISHQRKDGINFAAAFNGRHGKANLDEFTAELNKLIDKW